MLILTRKPNEDIYIGDNVKIKVTEIRGNTVRIGIDAPPDVPILRGELRPLDSGPSPKPKPNPKDKRR